ncbi:hypothetical protein TNIN_164451 [Trichonephila inaurata madagascariensis]|uniref:Uncharacterized protein n=1 Tax=Trichonephila inaurata madagascariensis TaxID=2747483 RepID=A0A8X6Y226_9ARAC|nr:hypothetical protein TNIN_164451 [Trichonephila inaurata madagascariensis]
MNLEKRRKVSVHTKEKFNQQFSRKWKVSADLYFYKSDRKIEHNLWPSKSITGRIRASLEWYTWTCESVNPYKTQSIFEQNVNCDSTPKSIRIQQRLVEFHVNAN